MSGAGIDGVVPESDALGRAILASLYLRGAVPVRRLARLPESATRPIEFEATLSRLRLEGMVAGRGGRVRLTPLGGRVAYGLACADPRPLATLLHELGEENSGRERQLDLGCGPGAYLPEEAASGQVVGVDRDPVALRIARTALGRAAAPSAPLVRADAERLPFAAEAFDRILCVVLLPYVREERVLREAARVLRPGGRLIVSSHGPGYYARLAGGRDVAWKRRLFGLVSIAGTWTRRVLGLTLPGARFQSAPRMAAVLEACGVRVTKESVHGRFLGLPERVRLVAVKGTAGDDGA